MVVRPERNAVALHPQPRAGVLVENCRRNVGAEREEAHSDRPVLLQLSVSGEGQRHARSATCARQLSLFELVCRGRPEVEAARAGSLRRLLWPDVDFEQT